jgi:uncharacterized membrane protein
MGSFGRPQLSERPESGLTKKLANDNILFKPGGRMDQLLDQRLRWIEGRLDTIETRLRLAPAPPPPLTKPPSMPPPIPTRAPEAPTAPALLKPLLSEPPPVISYRAAPSKPKASQGALEHTIGLKWAGWVGAVVLVIGAALGVKFVYDHDWFAAIPPAVWLSVIALAGGALIAAGEWVYRRVNIVPAASLFGAGVATLFLDAYVGHAYYKLYPPATAFWLMALTALVGSMVAMRGNLVSIAILSQIGGNVAALLVGNRDTPLASFLTYLTMLQIVALALALWGRSTKWWILRGLSLASIFLWMLPILNASDHGGTTAITFMLIWAALYHAELVVSEFLADRRAKTSNAPAAGLVFSTLVTAALTAGILVVYLDASRTLRTTWVLGLAAATGAASVALRGSSGVRLRSLALAYLIQSLALVTLAVPVALTGTRIEIAWGMLAIVLAILYRAARSPVAAWGALAAWALATAHLARSCLEISGASHGTFDIWLHIFGQNITAQAIIAWSLALASQAIAVLLRPSDQSGEDDALTITLPAFRGAATLMWIIASIVALPTLGATFWIVVYAWLLAASGRGELRAHAAAALIVATGKWLAIDTLQQRALPSWSPAQYVPILNPIVAVGMMLAASIAALAILRDRKSQPGAEALAMLVAFIIFWSGTFEIDRAVQTAAAARSLGWPLWQAETMLWTIWWCACLVGSFLLARRLTKSAANIDWLEIFPGLMTLLAAKFLIFDTLAWRVFDGVTLATVGANLESAAGASVIAGLVTIAALNQAASRRMILLAVCVLLWIASLEIDRAFEHIAGSGIFADPDRARQVALSIFWSAFAVAAVASGFRARFASLRYFGLGLLAVTLAKVVIVDLQQVSTGYRILSFLGVGLLMLGTSVLYGKLSPKLLAVSIKSDPQPIPDRSVSG